MLALTAIGFVINFFAEKGLRKFHENTGYRWFIIAEKAFDSAIVDLRGCIIEQTAQPIPSQAILVADSSLGTADSFYIQLGDLSGWAAMWLAWISSPASLLLAKIA